MNSTFSFKEREVVPVKIIGIGKKGDVVARNVITGKIVFLKNFPKSEIGIIKTLGVAKITKKHETFDIGEIIVYDNGNFLRGDIKIINGIKEVLKEIEAESIEGISIYELEDKYKKIKLGLGIKYKEDKYESEIVFLDLVDLIKKLNDCLKIIEYNKKISEINKIIIETITNLEKQKDTALTPEDWDFEKVTWKKSGIEKINKREKIIERIISKAKQIEKKLNNLEDVKIRKYVFLWYDHLDYESWKLIIVNNIIDIKPKKHFSPHFTNIEEVLKKYSIEKTNNGYIIKPFPIPIYSRLWDSGEYGALITSGIYAGAWKNEDYWYFRETTAFNKKAYVVYPVVEAKNEKEALEKAKKVADGDGFIENITVEKLTENKWLVSWTVID